LEVNKNQLIEHLIESNRGPQLETEYKIIKVLVLLDCTGSMGEMLLKTRNSIDKMFNEAKKVLLD
jgi:hypothetical protein